MHIALLFAYRIYEKVTSHVNHKTDVEEPPMDAKHKTLGLLPFSFKEGLNSLPGLICPKGDVAARRTSLRCVLRVVAKASPCF